MLGLLALFYVMVFWVIPLFMSFVVGTLSDTAILLGGQLFLTLVIGVVYCLLRDEIRNRDFYASQRDDLPDGEE